MSILNLQQKLYSLAKEVRTKFLPDLEIPDYVINVGHFAREHGYRMGAWNFEEGDTKFDVAEIFIDAVALNKGSVYITSILHHELIMISLRGKGTGSFDSRTKVFADAALSHGLQVAPTEDRFKFRSAKTVMEHSEEWMEWYDSLIDHPTILMISMLRVEQYPDLVSKRMEDSFRRDFAAGTLYPLPGGLLKPGTGGRKKDRTPTIKVKLTPDKSKDEAIDEASVQYDKLRSVMDSDTGLDY